MTANYESYSAITLTNGRVEPRVVPKWCAAGRVHTSPTLDGHFEQYPTPHDFRPTYNDTEGPGALCSACLLAIGANDLKPFHEAYYA